MVDTAKNIDLTDEEAMVEFQNGNAGAFDLLLKTHGSGLLRFIWGFLIFLTIYITCAPFLDSHKSDGDRETKGMLDEFERESQGILKEISRL